MNFHPKPFFSYNFLWKVLFVLFCIAEFWFSYKSVGPYPPRNYLASLAVPLLFFHPRAKEIFSQIFWGRYAVIFIGVLPPLIQLILHTFMPGLPPVIFLKVFLKMATIGILAIGALETLEEKFILKTILYTILVSAILAIFQYFDFQWSWELRRLIDPSTFGKAKGGSGSSGLAFFEVTLALHLLAGLTIAGYYLRVGSKSLKNIAIFIVFAIAIYTSHIKSVIGALPLLIIFTIPYETWQKKKIKLLTIGSVAGLVMVSGFTIIFLTMNGTLSDNSFILRPHLYMKTLYAVKDHFFLGMGEQYSNFAEIYSGVYFPGLDKGREVSDKLSSHFYLGRYILKFGAIGLIALAFYFRFILRAIFSNAPFSIPATFYFISELLNGFMHNAGALDVSYLWFFFLIFIHFSLQKTANLPHQNES